jgi:UrcA family protein
MAWRASLRPRFRKEANMFTPLLLSLAMISGEPEPVIVVNERPTIRILLTDYDLARPEGVRKLERHIRRAADRVCIRGSGLAMYLESRPCLTDAVADANAQLATVLSRRTSASLAGAAIVVSAPTK